MNYYFYDNVSGIHIVSILQYLKFSFSTTVKMQIELSLFYTKAKLSF